jgi:hypothetical protein
MKLRYIIALAAGIALTTVMAEAKGNGDCARQGCPNPVKACTQDCDQDCTCEQKQDCQQRDGSGSKDRKRDGRGGCSN